MKVFLISCFILFFSGFLSAQISGQVIDEINKTPVVGAKIMGADGSRAISDYDGKFALDSKKFPVEVTIIMLQYATETLVINAPGNIQIPLKERVKDFETVVISAGRRKQAIEEVPVSMEILRPQLIDNKGITDLEQAVDQTPGVFTMDGQVSIRGGSGFAYGAGSRVLLLWNGMPLLSGYA